MKAAHQCCGRLVRLQTQPGLVVREVTRDWIRDGWNPIATGKANTPSQLARMFSPFRSPVLTIGLRWREFPASRKSRYPGRKYTITITGSSGSLQHSAKVALTVN
jgi:hypothetical protein